MTRFSREDQLYACLALIKARKMGPVTWGRILSHYDSPAQALQDFGQWAEEKLVNSGQVEQFRTWSWEKEVLLEMEIIQKKSLQVIIWPDQEYPDMLKRISNPPLILYYRGDPGLLKNHSLAVVGSRMSSEYGLRMAFEICREMSRKGVTIVSGFASGIDRQAHLSALDGPGGTAAVLGTGIDLVYPARNTDLWKRIVQKGLIITEFFPGTKPDPQNFPFRNRIISGLSLGVLVVQSAMKSGSMITARLALDQNKEVFAVPGAVNMANYDGCNHLIKQGAHLVQSAEDILEVLAPLVRHSEGFRPLALSREQESDQEQTRIPEDLSSEEEALIRLLTRDHPRHIDELTRSSGCLSHQVSQTLVKLEIKGLIRRRPGMFYVLA